MENKNKTLEKIDKEIEDLEEKVKENKKLMEKIIKEGHEMTKNIFRIKEILNEKL